MNKKITTEKVVNKKYPFPEMDTNPFEGEENKKYNKVIGDEEQMNTEKFREPSKVKETLAGMSELEEDNHTYDTEINKSYRSYRDRSSRMVFLIFFGVVIVIGGGLYFLLQNSGTSVTDKTQFIQTEETVNTTYVDRNYDIPITYPYVQTETGVQIHGLNSELISGPVSEKPSGTEENTTNVVNEIKSTPPNNKVEQVPTVRGTQVALNIFKYGEAYVVQVGAFRSKTVAENEVAKFSKLGHNSFIEEAVVNGKNWFRVRVGDFTTLEAAKQFQK